MPLALVRPIASTAYAPGYGSARPLIAREAGPPEAPKPRLLDRMRAAVRARHYSRRTEKAYVAWARRYILFHDKRHPLQMGGPEVAKFLTSLAVDGRVAASTQNQALRDEVRAILRQLRGTQRLIAILLYGAGLRLLEALRLRVKDVDFARNQIMVRAGKGDKDRATPLPTVVIPELALHLDFIASDPATPHGVQGPPRYAVSRYL